MKPTVSVVVITRNEEAMIGAALDSVAWADEIVVVDGGSTDGTLAICRARAHQVVSAPDWPGFGPQKNRAVDLARGDWILALDADERVSPELAAEIRAVLCQPAADVYAIPRLSSFLGRPIRHGDWWPDRVERLFRRGLARFSDDPVHERLLHDGRRGELRGLLHHDSIRSLEQMLAKMNHYTSAGAGRVRARGASVGLASAIGHGLWAFLRAYLLRRGFLDGREGFVLAVSAAESAYYRYLKAACDPWARRSDFRS